MILTGQKELVRDWICSQIRDWGEPPQDKYEAIGVVRDKRIIGGTLYTHYLELGGGDHDIRMHCAGMPGWLTPNAVRTFFEYPFCQLGVSRVTGMCAKANWRSRELLERLGFRLEGIIRHGMGQGKDMTIYGMLRSECRWIKELAHEQSERQRSEGP